MKRGFIHVYTGDGKGKTTAALGLALRAVCAGKRVFIGQFIKGMEYSELKSVDYLPNLVIEQFGRDCFIYREPEKEDIRLAKAGLDRCRKILKEGNYDIVVLDEINIAIYYNLFTVYEAIEVIKEKAPHLEVIITGRRADDRIVEIADLVTEMKEIKHYYNEGIEARKGIEF